MEKYLREQSRQYRKISTDNKMFHFLCETSTELRDTYKKDYGHILEFIDDLEAFFINVNEEIHNEKVFKEEYQILNSILA